MIRSSGTIGALEDDSSMEGILPMRGRSSINNNNTILVKQEYSVNYQDASSYGMGSARDCNDDKPAIEPSEPSLRSIDQQHQHQQQEQHSGWSQIP